MRRICSFLLLLTICLSTFADDYVPSTMWPYLFEDFEEGLICYKNGDKASAHINIHLLYGDLHYLKYEEIRTVDPATIGYVEIGSDKYVVADNKIMRVIAELPETESYVLESKMGDFDAIFVGNGAYGSSANTQAVRNLSSVEIGGINITNHAKLLQEKLEDNGKEVSIKEKYYLKVGEIFSEAAQKDVEKAFISDDKSAGWKSFLKSEKIKWRKPDDLLKVLKYIQQ